MTSVLKHITYFHFRLSYRTVLLFIQLLLVSGAPGPPGDAGEPGHGGPLRSGFLLVVHSQSVHVPQCPAASNQLWVGDSLIYLTHKIWVSLALVSLFSPPCLSPTVTEMPATTQVTMTNPIGFPLLLLYP
ncbi:hypothetical protein ILYODFUR_006428 [Ilyodon furcidens]|uniref:Collagen IV NC1 domain-containing protein n=1 Tax=Ilyodon furcidens TaxID=33524 RepID=A0ABV0V0S7_9TELE